MRSFLKLNFFHQSKSLCFSYKKFNSSAQCIELEDKYGCHNYKPLPFVAAKGSGVYLTDVEGNVYMDFLSGISAVNQGHCHPKIAKAMEVQLRTLTLTSRAFHTNRLGVLQKYLCELFNYDKALLMNSGVEAGDSAIKFARRWGYDVKKIPDNQAKVLLAKGNYWGRSIAACASSDNVEITQRFGPYGGLGFELIDYNSPEVIESHLAKDPYVAAVMLEPIQGEVGVNIPSSGYLKRVKEICHKYKVLFIGDEIQTGLGRTGKLLACDWDGVHPDILLLGKSLSGGFYPVSAVLSSDEVMMNIKPGQHGSTYGGNPLAAFVCKTAVETLIEENMIENSRVVGEYFLQGLKEVCKLKSFMKEARGKGLMCAMEVKADSKPSAWDLCLLLKEEGLVTRPTNTTVIRLCPPLVLKKSEAEEALNKIEKVLKKF